MSLHPEARRLIDEALKCICAFDASSAEENFRRAAAVDPSSLEPWGQLAYLCYRQKRYTEAVQFYLRSLRCCPTWVEGYVRLLLCLIRGSGSRTRKSLLRSARGRKVLGLWYFPWRSLVWLLLRLTEAVRGRRRAASHVAGIPIALSRILREYLTGGVDSIIFSPIYARCTEFPLTLNRLEPRDGLIILEVACGWTPLPKILRDMGCQVIGIDLSPQAILCAARARWNRHAASSFLQSDAMALPFDDETFDRVFSISAVEHFATEVERQTMKEIGRVLRPGGIAVITASGGTEEQEISYSIDGASLMFRKYTPESIRERLVKPSGLETVETVFFGERSPIGWHLIPHGDSRQTPTQILTPLLASLRTRRLSENELEGAYWCIPCLVLRKSNPH
jgi:2-polyprenyl-3-methyl-5-hydroxy-6-metoxy-1,4-benzoquinol methylase